MGISPLMDFIRSNSCLAAITQYKLTPCLFIKINFDFGDEFRLQTETRSTILNEIINRFCWNSIANKAITYLTVTKIWAILKTWECRNGYVQNGRHDIIDFECSKTKKNALTNILESICVNFHKNLPSRLDCRPNTRTHTHTGTLGSILIYSVRMTEYKNKNT